MDAESLNTLVQCARSHQEQGAVGRNLRNWACNFVSRDTHDYLLEQLPPEQVSRHSLKTFCQRADTSSQACFCAVMAWGGMRADHARRAWSLREQWSPVLNALQAKATSRGEAYKRLKECRTKGALPGIRPAFFTKLLFFLRPSNDAYIMDQWTAKSINMLFDRDVVLLSRDGFVSDENSPERYESFCQCIEEVAAAVSSELDQTISGELMEEILMSKGGRRAGQWRVYVRTHWRGY